MGLFDGLRARALGLTKEFTGGVADSGHTAIYLRQLLRGNHGARPHLPSHDVPEEGGLLREGGGERPPSPPVLLIHGYFATRGSLHLLERHLVRRGHVVMSYPLGAIFNLGDIRDSAGLIARKVESIVAAK